MMAYIDSSAFLRGILDQDLSGQARSQRDAVQDQGGQLVSSRLLELETRRTQIRLGEVWGPYRHALLGVGIVELEPQDFSLAFDIDAHTKSLDALHLACCMKVEADVLLTADKTMREVAEHFGIDVRWAG